MPAPKKRLNPRKAVDDVTKAQTKLDVARKARKNAEEEALHGGYIDRDSRSSTTLDELERLDQAITDAERELATAEDALAKAWDNPLW